MRRTTRSIIALLILIVIVISVTSAVGKGLMGSGYLVDAWGEMLGVIPFGGVVANLTDMIFKYMTGYSAPLPAGMAPVVEHLLPELLKAMLIALCCEALTQAGYNWMEVSGQSGFGIVIQKFLWGVLCAYLSIFVAGIVANIFLEQVAQMPNGIVRNIILGLTTGGVAIGGIAIIHFALGLGALLAVIYLVGKVIILTMVKLYVNYVLVALLLQLLYSGAAAQMIGSLGGIWLLLMIILTGIELMLSSIIQL